MKKLNIFGFMAIGLISYGNMLTLDRDCDKNDLLMSLHNQEDQLISKIENEISSKNFSIEIQ